MAEVLRYVDTDVIAGDGSGDSLINAYSSSAACEAAEQTDLVSDGDTFRALCYATGGTADSAVIITGWTTGASNGIKWMSSDDDRASKESYDNAKYRVEDANTTCFYVLENYVHADGLQIKLSTTGTQGAAFRSLGLDAVSNLLYISNCRIEAGSITGAAANIYGIRFSDSDIIAKLWNNIVSGFVNGASFSYGINVDSSSDADIYNCVVEGCQYNIAGGETSHNVYNTISFNSNASGGDFLGTFGTINYCASDDGDGTNAISPSGSDWANEMPNYATGDYTAINSGNIYHGGINNPQSGLFSTDIDGNTYNNPPTVGVNEIGAESEVKIKMNVGDVWIDYDSFPVNIVDAWKDKVVVKAVIGEVWKDVD